MSSQLAAVLEFEAFSNTKLYVLHFADVTNAREVRDKILSGTLRPECSVFDASMVAGLLPIQAAAYRALKAKEKGALRTRSLYAELVFNISGSNHISETFKRFGLSDGTTSIVLCIFDANEEDMGRLKDAVSGKQIAATQHAAIRNTEHIKKCYKITPEELKLGSLEEAVLSKIASKECL